MAYYDSRSHMLDRLEAAYSDLEDSIDEHKEALARIDALEDTLDKVRDILWAHSDMSVIEAALALINKEV